MTLGDERVQAIAAAIADIREILAAGVSDQSLSDAKTRLVALARRAELFPRADFPLPRDGETDRTFRLREDPDGALALYVNSGVAGQTTRPHDHGGAWAIVVGVEGREQHKLYRRSDDQSRPGIGRLEVAEEVEVAPGSGVVLGPEGIHSIHATAPEPLLHLHLYGFAFEKQSTRKEYDLAAGSYRAYTLDDTGFIEDAP